MISVTDMASWAGVLLALGTLLAVAYAAGRIFQRFEQVKRDVDALGQKVREISDKNEREHDEFQEISADLKSGIKEIGAKVEIVVALLTKLTGNGNGTGHGGKA